MHQEVASVKRGWLIPAILGFFALIALFAFLGTERHAGVSKFCTVCAAEEQSSYWTIRKTNIKIYSSTLLAETPFSSVLNARQLVKKHNHKWQAPLVVANPDKWDGAPIISSLGNLNAPRIVSFTKNLIDYSEPSLRDTWISIVMQPDTAHVMDAALFYIGMPESGFTSKQEFLRWLGVKLPMLSTRIEVLEGHD